MEEFEHKLSGVTLRPGSGGVFEVAVDGKLVFSKKSKGRFPEYEEVAWAIG